MTSFRDSHEDQSQRTHVIRSPAPEKTASHRTDVNKMADEVLYELLHMEIVSQMFEITAKDEKVCV